jgi:putative Ca2+/H+ antiporter (TMEM165/GDT1 family)
MSAQSPGLRGAGGRDHPPVLHRGRAGIALSSGERPLRVSFHVALVCFPLIFLAELPDKTMFASLLMATKGRPARVWLGAAEAFLIHVAIATPVGVALFAVLPHQAIDAVVAFLFFLGAIYAWREGTEDKAVLVDRERTRHGAILTAFVSSSWPNGAT